MISTRNTSLLQRYTKKLFMEFDEVIVLPSKKKNISGTIIYYTNLHVSSEIPESTLVFIPQDNGSLTICWKNGGMGLNQISAQEILSLLPPVNEKSTDKAFIQTLIIKSGLLYWNLLFFLEE